MHDTYTYLSGSPFFSCRYEPLIARFGRGILEDAAVANSPVSRAKLGGVVFGNPAALADLNGIVWPVIRGLAEEILGQHPERVCVVDAAVLLQAGWGAFVDEVWCVFAPRADAHQRLMARNGLNDQQATARLDGFARSLHPLPSCTYSTA